MKRRDFGKILTTGAFGSSVSYKNNVKAAQNQSLMHVGTQRFGNSVSSLQFKKRHGVEHHDPGKPDYTPGTGWIVDQLLKWKGISEENGVSLDMLHMQLLSSGIVNRNGSLNDKYPLPNIMLGKSPERDYEIEDICKMIETAADAGIRGINYNLIILPVLYNASTPGRGGSSYRTWDIDKYTGSQTTILGEVTETDVWERITYFLERVIPIAEQYKVQMACHQPDPPTPSGFCGIHRWDSDTFAGLKRFTEIAESPYHGLNFCVGSISEGLEDPGTEILEIARYFGEQNKIFNVHFRNIRGNRNNYMEVYPDEGDIDMYELMKVFYEVGYPYMLMPDHMPSHSGDTGGYQAFAGGYMYINGLIQAVKDEYVETAIKSAQALPENFTIKGNYPNPFNLNTTIEFMLPSAGHTDLAVYNSTGQKIRTLVSSSISAGAHRQNWDGCDDSGATVSSGVYFSSLKMGNYVTALKMTLIK
ncbi:mannonate dehydratase [Candidatus Latescibacterota bacterium]